MLLLPVLCTVHMGIGFHWNGSDRIDWWNWIGKQLSSHSETTVQRAHKRTWTWCYRHCCCYCESRTWRQLRKLEPIIKCMYLCAYSFISMHSLPFPAYCFVAHSHSDTPIRSPFSQCLLCLYRIVHITFYLRKLQFCCISLNDTFTPKTARRNSIRMHKSI